MIPEIKNCKRLFTRLCWLLVVPTLALGQATSQPQLARNVLSDAPIVTTDDTLGAIKVAKKSRPLNKEMQSNNVMRAVAGGAFIAGVSILAWIYVQRLQLENQRLRDDNQALQLQMDYAPQPPQGGHAPQPRVTQPRVTQPPQVEHAPQLREGGHVTQPRVTQPPQRRHAPQPPQVHIAPHVPLKNSTDSRQSPTHASDFIFEVKNRKAYLYTEAEFALLPENVTTNNGNNLIFNNLPNDIFEIIFQDLSLKDLAAVCETSKACRNFLNYKVPYIYFRALYLHLLSPVHQPIPYIHRLQTDLLLDIGEGEQFNPRAFFSNLPKFLIKGWLPVDRAAVFFADLAKFEAAYSVKVRRTFDNLPLRLLIAMPGKSVRGRQYVGCYTNAEKESLKNLKPLFESFPYAAHPKFSLDLNRDLIVSFSEENPETYRDIFTGYLTKQLNHSRVKYLRMNVDAYDFVAPFVPLTPESHPCFPNLEILHLYVDRMCSSSELKALPELKELVIEDTAGYGYYQGQYPRSSSFSAETLQALNSESKVPTIRFLEGYDYLSSLQESLKNPNQPFYGFKKVILHLSKVSPPPNDVQGLTKNQAVRNFFSSIVLDQLRSGQHSNAVATSTQNLKTVELHSAYTGDIEESTCVDRVSFYCS